MHLCKCLALRFLLLVTRFPSNSRSVFIRLHQAAADGAHGGTSAGKHVGGELADIKIINLELMRFTGDNKSRWHKIKNVFLCRSLHCDVPSHFQGSVQLLNVLAGDRREAATVIRQGNPSCERIIPLFRHVWGVERTHRDQNYYNWCMALIFIMSVWQHLRKDMWLVQLLQEVNGRLQLSSDEEHPSQNQTLRRLLTFRHFQQ